MKNDNDKKTIALTPSDLPVWVDADDLWVDTDNQRKTYDAEKLSELADSIYVHGVLQNLEAFPTGRVNAGNRRIRALKAIVIPRLVTEIAAAESDEARAELEAKLARVRKVPTKVLSEVEASTAKERQLIENLQREDLNPYEECAAIVDLLGMRNEDGSPRYSPESLAARTGLTVPRIHSREKALNAPTKMLTAFREGKVGVSLCEIVGRIPNESDRKLAAEMILNPKETATPGKPLTKDEARDLIATKFQVSLRGAPFDQAQTNLIPEAGDCVTCRFRTGCDSSLKLQVTGGDGGGGARGAATDICQNPSCYRAKCHAAWKLITADAERDGYGVLTQEKARFEFTPSGSLQYSSDYVDLDSKPLPRHTGHFSEKGLRKWREILKGVEVKVWKAQNPVTHKVHNLVKYRDITTALELVKEAAGGLTEFTGASELALSGGTTEGRRAASERAEEERKRREKEAKAKEKAEAELEKRVETATVDAVADSLRLSPGGLLPDWVLETLFETLANNYADGAWWLAKYLCIARPHPGASGRDFVKPLKEVFSRTASRLDREILIVLASVAVGLKMSGLKCSDFQRIATGLNLDLDGIRKAVVDEIAAERKEKEGETGRGGVGEKGLDKDINSARGMLEVGWGDDSINPEQLAKLMNWSKARALEVHIEMGVRGVLTKESKLAKEGAPEKQSGPNSAGVLAVTKRVEIAKVKKAWAIAKVAQWEGRWYAGYDFNEGTRGSSGPASISRESFETELLAIKAVAIWALEFFKSSGQPAAFIDAIRKAAGMQTGSLGVLNDRCYQVVRHFAGEDPMLLITTHGIALLLPGITDAEAKGIMKRLNEWGCLTKDGGLNRNAVKTREILAASPVGQSADTQKLLGEKRAGVSSREKKIISKAAKAPAKKAPARATSQQVALANDFYEAEVSAGRTISIAEVEVKFTLKDGQLANFRKNKVKLAKRKAAKGKGGRK